MAGSLMFYLSYKGADALLDLNGIRGRPPMAWCAPRVKGRECHKYCAGSHLVHLVEEDLLAGLLGQRAKPRVY